MIRSMTGYSSVREYIEDSLVSLEIKALNHKSFDLHFHCSRLLTMLELPLREYVQKYIRRGRIEVYLRNARPLIPDETIRPNPDAARAYIKAAKTLAQDLELTYHPTLETILNVEGVLTAEDALVTPEQGWNMLHSLIEKAVEQLLEMKRSEGERLHVELESLLGKIEQANQDVVSLRAQVIDEYRQKLLARVQEWQDQINIDPNRVVQEVALFADKSDIQEETVRLKSHVHQFRQTLNENTDDVDYLAVGRKLDFLCQEMFREANTIGSKSSAIEVTRIGMEMKSIIEQIREQVQNIE